MHALNSDNIIYYEQKNSIETSIQISYTNRMKHVHLQQINAQEYNLNNQIIVRI